MESAGSKSTTQGNYPLVYDLVATSSGDYETCRNRIRPWGKARKRFS